LERDESGRYVVRFPDLPEALTDGVDETEALVEAADCLSEALASRIVDGDEIPSPSSLDRGQYLISPDPIIALKAALHTALEERGMTTADLADRLGMKDWHQAARLIDPKRPSKLRRLAAALDALGRKIEIVVVSPGPEIADRAPVRLGSAEIAARFPRWGSRCTSRATCMGEIHFSAHRTAWFPLLRPPTREPRDLYHITDAQRLRH
jgi:antitoxin HicB